MSTSLRGVCIGLALTLMVSSVCHALSSTAPVGTGEYVEGCCGEACAYSIGYLAKPKNVEDDFDWFKDTLEDQIEDVGDSYKSGLKKIVPTLNKRFESQNAVIRQLLTSFGAADEKFRNTLIFGERSKAFLDWRRSAYLTGKAATAEFSRTLSERMEEYSRSFSKNSDILSRLSSVSNSSISSQGFFSANATLAKDRLKNMIASLRTTVNAFPALSATSLPDQERRAYRSIRRAKRIRIAAAQSVFSDAMSGYAPTVPVKNKIEELASDSTRIVDGRISPVGLLELLVKSRFASDEYRTGKTGIHTMTRTGVLRELASVQALRLAIERRQLYRARQMALLEAMQVSGLTTGRSLNLWDLYQRTAR